MTARWAHLTTNCWKIINLIINEITAVSRVTYDIYSKRPVTIKWGARNQQAMSIAFPHRN